MEGKVFVALWASQRDLEPSRANISPQSPCSLIPALVYLSCVESVPSEKTNHILIPRFIGYLCITDIANSSYSLTVLKILPLYHVMTLLGARLNDVLGFISTVFGGSQQCCFALTLPVNNSVEFLFIIIIIIITNL